MLLTFDKQVMVAELTYIPEALKAVVECAHIEVQYLLPKAQSILATQQIVGHQRTLVEIDNALELASY